MSSIPLVALGVQQQPGPLDQYGKAMQLKQLMNANALAPGQQQLQQQQVQAGQQEIQQRQLALQDQQAATKAMQQWSGKDPSELPELIKQNGGSYDAVMNAKNGVIKQQTELASLNTAQLNIRKTQNDYLLGKLQSATGDNVPDEQLGQSIIQAANGAVQDGYLDPQHAQQLAQMVSQTTDPKALRSQLSIFEKSLQGQSEQFAQATKERELANSGRTADAAMLRAQNTSPSAEAIAAKAAQGDPTAIATQQEVVKQAARKAASEAQAKQPFEIQLSSARAQADQAVKNGSADDAGRMLAQGLIAPSEIAARSNPSFLVQANKAALDADPHYNAQKAEADFNVAKSVSNSPFFGSAGSLVSKGGTLDQLKENYQKLGNAKLPLFNKLSDYLSYQAGNPAMAGFLQTAIGAADDYAKVMGGGTGSDSSRLQVLQSFSNAHSPAQMDAAINAARNAVGSQIESRIGSNKVLRNMYGGQGAAQGGGQSSNAAPPTLKVGQTVSVKGKNMTVTAVHPDGSFDAK